MGWASTAYLINLEEEGLGIWDWKSGLDLGLGFKIGIQDFVQAKSCSPLQFFRVDLVSSLVSGCLFLFLSHITFLFTVVKNVVQFGGGDRMR